MVVRGLKCGTALALLAMLTLAGCQSSSESNSPGFSVGGIVQNVTGSSEGPAFSQLSPQPGSFALGFASVPSRASVDNADARYTALRAPSMERYMQSIAMRLLRHWNGEKPERMGFFVTPDDAVSGYTLPTGDVLISIRAIESMRSEDEFAALIAHEMAHVLLKHHENERAVKKLTRVGQLAASAAAVVAVSKRMDKRRTGGRVEIFLPESQKSGARGDILTSYGAFQAGLTLATTLGVSAYNRHQEDVADKFAVEMLHHAGYSPDGMSGVLEHLRTVEAEQEKRKKQYELQARSLDAAIVEVASLAFSEIHAAVNRSHPDPDARLRRVQRHMGVMIGEDGVPPNKSMGGLNAARAKSDYRQLANFFVKLNRLLASDASTSRDNQIRSLLRSGYGRTAVARTLAYPAIYSFNPDAAHEMLKSATNTGNAPLSYFTFLAQGHAARKNTSGAKSAISAIASNYGWDVAYPAGIQVASIIPDQEWSLSLHQRCMAQAPAAVKRECDKAKTQSFSDQEFRQIPSILDALGQAPASAVSQGKGIGDAISGLFSYRQQ